MRSENRSQTRNTRRTFLKSTGAVAAGVCLTRTANAGGETLAVNGGLKAVTASHEDASTWPRYGAEEEQAVLELVRKPNYGPIGALEEEWKQHFSLPYCKAHYNGTSAITAMFFALDLPPGSEIMVPCSTFWATIMPMRFFGLVPVFVDIHPRTLNFDVEDAKRKLTKDTKAMFPVHYLGLPADMDHICDFAQEKGLIALEDACHAHGASLHGKPMGAWGRMACFSFQASKPMPAIEGGMGNYQDREDYERAATLGHYECPRTFAAGSKYGNYGGTGLGLKLRMHPMAAALARCQLKKLAKRNADGTAQTRRLNDRLVQLPGLYEQQNRPDVDRLFYTQNRFLFNETEAGMSREACIKALRAEGVSVRAAGAQFQCDYPAYHEPQWWHHLPVIADQFPGAEEVNRRGISLPYFTKDVPELVDQYIQAFEKIWAHRKELAKV
ncbi:MAG: DegT/DnrJ/EryC1/StrS family aminotransferase [Planctomycetes bacterium]|nr:DegT/DnrJ/EryC1/StrS family aminotransferase [Planctomycetota bacterium]MBL7044224.1 DegT/DnrJ/EryC1/StrS family aminotransferase [Pirellulaceae bacterium]